MPDESTALRGVYSYICSGVDLGGYQCIAGLVIAYFILPCLLAYLIGSIPFGLLLTKAVGLGDIRTIGSGNIGATNVLRTGNKKLALLTLLLDMGKGSAAVLLGYALGGGYIVGLFVILGHIFPVWLKFKGGKGVATAFGVLLIVSPWVALAGFVTWAITFMLTRISSLSAIVAFALAPAYAYFLLHFTLSLPIPNWPFWQGATYSSLYIGAISMLIIAKHHANIRRLIAGTEPRFGHG